jgi:mannitol-1-phosphate/altronate dehydrogenase
MPASRRQFVILRVALRARLTWATDPGIIIAADIAPYRKRKVHLLNGAHTLLVPVALPIRRAWSPEASVIAC